MNPTFPPGIRTRRSGIPSSVGVTSFRANPPRLLASMARAFSISFSLIKVPFLPVPMTVNDGSGVKSSIGQFLVKNSPIEDFIVETIMDRHFWPNDSP